MKTSKIEKQYTSGVRPWLKNVACLSSLVIGTVLNTGSCIKLLLVRVVAVRTSTVYWRWWRTWNIIFSCFQLDCGIHPGMSGLESLPFLDEIDTAEIDLLLVSQWVIKMMMITTAIIFTNDNNNNYHMANPVLGKSLCSDWFFLGQVFAVWTISMETVQSVYFCFGAKPANSKFSTQTAKKKCENCHSSHWNYQQKLKIEIFPKFQRWMKKTNIFYKCKPPEVHFIIRNRVP